MIIDKKSVWLHSVTSKSQSRHFVNIIRAREKQIPNFFWDICNKK